MIKSYNSSQKDCIDLLDLYNLAAEENNTQIAQETLKKFLQLKESVKKNEIKCFLSNKNDNFNVYLEIHAGAGGTESQDWAEMLRRMYMKWTASKEFKYELIS